MAGYTVTAFSVDQNGPTTHFTVAICVIDTNGLGVQNLGASDFTVRNVINETHFTVAELQSANLQGFYRLSMRAEPAANAGEYILALMITHHHAIGRISGDAYVGSTLVKLRVV
ncbi:MAG: hypothetical protein NVS2B12_40830 [Ktedonobacteraceae bacterium]